MSWDLGLGAEGAWGNILIYLYFSYKSISMSGSRMASAYCGMFPGNQAFPEPWGTFLWSVNTRKRCTAPYNSILIANFCGLFLSIAVSGVAMELIFLINCWSKLVNPIKHWTSLMVAGIGQLVNAIISPGYARIVLVKPRVTENNWVFRTIRDEKMYHFLM